MGRDNWILIKEMDEDGIYTFKCKHYFNPKEYIRTEHTFCTIDKKNCPVNPTLGKYGPVPKYDCNGFLKITWTEMIVGNISILSKEIKEAYEIPF